MERPAPDVITKEEERRQLRPYRRFVRVVFFAAVALMCTLLLRGIIRSLDRMPSASGLKPDGPVDVRALRACAEDLSRLETTLRVAGGSLLAGAPDSTENWETKVHPLELERQQIVARCRLDEESNDPAVEDLRSAASAIEDLARNYALLFDRHRREGAERSREAAAALKRATEALKSRK